MSPARPASIDLSAVAGELAELGPERASSAALARAAGVAKPTLYARFGSREGLVRACVEQEAELLLDRVYSSSDAGAALHELCPRVAGLAAAPAGPSSGGGGCPQPGGGAHRGGGSPAGTGLRPQAAATAFLAAAAAVLESEPAAAAPRALRALASALLP